jgi:hypothetical protein
LIDCWGVEPITIRNRGEEMEHMSAIKRGWGLTLVVFSAVAALCGNVRCDPPDCSNQYAEMAPCLPFVQGQESPPADACCKALGDVRKNSPVCLCMLVAPGSPGTSAGGGIPGLNATLELMLPSLCKVQADPSQCSRKLCPFPACVLANIASPLEYPPCLASHFRYFQPLIQPLTLLALSFPSNLAWFLV